MELIAEVLTLYIKKINLKNFRNYRDLDIELCKGVNIFYGNNAQGKTNIIESVYIASTGKSKQDLYQLKKSMCRDIEDAKEL